MSVALVWLVPRRELDQRANAAAPIGENNAPSQREAIAPEGSAKAAEPSAAKAVQDDAAKPTVVIALKASPADVRVTLDGAEVSVPFSGEFRRGTALHHLEATAKGYQPYKKLIDYSTDQTIKIVPQPQPRVRRGGGGSRADSNDNASDSVDEPATAVAAPPEPAPVAQPPAPGADMEFVKPRIKPTEIDTLNPYSKKK